MYFKHNKKRFYPKKLYKFAGVYVTATLVMIISSWMPAYSQNENQALLLEKQAEAAFYGFELNSAVDYLEKALEIAAHSPRENGADLAFIQTRLANTVFMRGAIYFSSSRPENAIADFSRAIDMKIIKPDGDIRETFPYRTAYILRGMAYVMTARYDAAMADFDVAKEMDNIPGEDPWVSFFAVRGYTYLYMGDIQQAELDLQTALEKYPEDPLGHCLDTDLAIASGDAKKVLESITNHLVQCNKNDDHNNNEMETLRQYILNNSALPTADEFCSGGESALQENNSSKAVDLYYICFTIEPENPKVSFNLARAYAMDGDSMKAKHFYYRYLYLVPGAPDNKEVLEAIDALNPKESVDEIFKNLNEQ